MPLTPHVEKHVTVGDTVRDIVIGMSDGLTVPFALAAGLTGAISQSRLIITAGFAEIAAGSIAMGLGSYLAARGDAEHYTHKLAREQDEVAGIPDAEAQEVSDIFRRRRGICVETTSRPWPLEGGMRPSNFRSTDSVAPATQHARAWL